MAQLPVPGWLAYSANHMWLEIDNDGCCHIGIDAFLARILGRVDKLSFLPVRPGGLPSAILTAFGVDLQMVFPNRLILAASNTHLRSNPEKLVSHPYTLGWLFEGREAGAAFDGDTSTVFCGLRRGSEAVRWMESEVTRLSAYVRDQSFRSNFEERRFMTDGGMFGGELIRHLGREQILCLFHEFFSAYASWRK